MNDSARAGLPPGNPPSTAEARPESQLHDVPLFPLATVLFPEGLLPLRIFETRYMDMIRECMKSERPFGVCRIVRGNETGVAADHEPIGCLAKIVSWDMPQLGLLHVTAVGEQRFAVETRRVEPNALVRADLRLMSVDPPVAVPDEFAPCIELLRRLVTELEQRGGSRYCAVAKPYRFDVAGWAANRLAEFLPIDPAARQKLLEIDEPLARLGSVSRILVERGVLAG